MSKKGEVPNTPDYAGSGQSLKAMTGALFFLLPGVLTSSGAPGYQGKTRNRQHTTPATTSATSTKKAMEDNSLDECNFCERWKDD
jgi:hypothetical protein